MPETQADNREKKSLREMLDDLLALASGLSAWEVDFIESLNEWEGDFTPRQAQVLIQIWWEQFPSEAPPTVRMIRRSKSWR